MNRPISLFKGYGYNVQILPTTSLHPNLFDDTHKHTTVNYNIYIYKHMLVRKGNYHNIDIFQGEMGSLISGLLKCS